MGLDPIDRWEPHDISERLRVVGGGDGAQRDARIQCNGLHSVMVFPGEDTQHDNFEREEREDLTDVHRTCLYSLLAAARRSGRNLQGRS